MKRKVHIDSSCCQYYAGNDKLSAGTDEKLRLIKVTDELNAEYANVA
jgi:hypothetical protein